MFIHLNNENSTEGAIERGRRLTAKFPLYVIAKADNQTTYLHMGFNTHGVNETQLNMLENLADKRSYLVGAKNNVFEISCTVNPLMDGLCTFEPVEVHIFEAGSSNVIDISQSFLAAGDSGKYKIDVQTTLRGADVLVELVAEFENECQPGESLGVVAIKRNSTESVIRMKGLRTMELKFNNVDGQPMWAKWDVEMNSTDSMTFFIDVNEVPFVVLGLSFIINTIWFSRQKKNP